MASTAANVIGSTISLTKPSARAHDSDGDDEPDEAPRPYAEAGNAAEEAGYATRPGIGHGGSISRGTAVVWLSGQVSDLRHGHFPPGSETHRAE